MFDHFPNVSLQLLISDGSRLFFLLCQLSWRTEIIDLWTKYLFRREKPIKRRQRKKCNVRSRTLSSLDSLCIKSHRIFQALNCIGTNHRKKNWSKYEDQYYLIFMNRAGSRIVFNNNSPTCNAFRMTERSIFVAISLAFGMVRHCWLFKNGDTSAPVYTSQSTPMQTWIWYVVCTTYLNEWMNIES